MDTNQLFQQSWLDLQAVDGKNIHVIEIETSKIGAAFNLLTSLVPGF
jgi:hypothetical protein